LAGVIIGAEMRRRELSIPGCIWTGKRHEFSTNIRATYLIEKLTLLFYKDQVRMKFLPLKIRI
jgi:hypothetical protein